MRAERGRRRPRVDGRNVLEELDQRFGIRRVAGLGNVRAHVPELPEVTAALIRRIVVPQQLARHLVIEPYHVALDEAMVGQQQAQRIRRHPLDAGQHVVGRKVAQRRVHRLRKIRGGHDRLERIGQRPLQARSELEKRQRAPRNGADRI